MLAFVLRFLKCFGWIVDVSCILPAKGDPEKSIRSTVKLRCFSRIQTPVDDCALGLPPRWKEAVGVAVGTCVPPRPEIPHLLPSHCCEVAEVARPSETRPCLAAPQIRDAVAHKPFASKCVYQRCVYNKREMQLPVAFWLLLATSGCASRARAQGAVANYTLPCTAWYSHLIQSSCAAENVHDPQRCASYSTSSALLNSSTFNTHQTTSSALFNNQSNVSHACETGSTTRITYL